LRTGAALWALPTTKVKPEIPVPAAPPSTSRPPRWRGEPGARVLGCRQTLRSWRGVVMFAGMIFFPTAAVCARRAAAQRARTDRETDPPFCRNVRRCVNAKRALRRARSPHALPKARRPSSRGDRPSSAKSAVAFEKLTRRQSATHSPNPRRRRGNIGLTNDVARRIAVSARLADHARRSVVRTGRRESLCA
jgi:hypothetical protein